MPENLPGGNKKRPQIKFSMYWMYVFIGMFLVGMWYVGDNPATKKVTYSEFENYITDSINSHAHGITKIVVEKRKGTAEAMLSDSLAKVVFHENQIKSGSPAVITTTLPSTDEFARKIDQWKQNGIYTGPVDYDEGSDFGSLLWNFGPILILIAFWFFIMRRMTNRDGGPGGVFSVGKSKAQVFDKDNAMKVTFADVAGLSEAKTEIEEIVEFLKDPPEQEKRFLPKLWQGRPTCRSSPCRDRISWRCLWVSVPRECATSFRKPRRRRPASCSSTRLTPLDVLVARIPIWVLTTSVKIHSTSCSPKWTVSAPTAV